MVLVTGLALAGLGGALILNLGGLAEQAIRRLTSRKLGRLAPGYAATIGGFRVYAALILSLGVAVGGVGLSPLLPVVGLATIGVGLAGFVIASAIALSGEVRTYRALPGHRGPEA